MYIQKINRKQNGKVYTSTILAESYRKEGKMKRRIIANLTKVPQDIVEGIKNFLKTGPDFSFSSIPYSQGKSCGALIVIKEIAKRLGITKHLGNDNEAKLAIFQIAARIMTQKSRLFASSAWQKDQAVSEVLGLDKFNEDNLYRNLDWLCDKQAEIEDKLFAEKSKGSSITEIYLYDVTSSYFEGDCNELSAYGYNRDGKKGKKQIVIGLLCDKDGDPISVQVFKGNTSDPKTVEPQLKKLKDRFGIKKVVFVGDNGMIKSSQISEITKENYNFITSITKAQIERLVKDGVIQYDLFDGELAEVEHEGIRYILRRNPIRAEGIEANRKERLLWLENKMEHENKYLNDHKRAKVEKALKRIELLITNYKFNKIISVTISDEKLVYTINKEALAEQGKFDGCYVVKTDLSREVADTCTVHERYKDLANVELAFRTLKTGLEEVRPIFVRKASRTRGHVFVCMLAYKIVKYIWDNIKDKTPLTRKGVFETLDKIQFIEYDLPNYKMKRLPANLPSHQREILDELKIKLPITL